MRGKGSVLAAWLAVLLGMSGCTFYENGKFEDSTAVSEEANAEDEKEKTDGINFPAYIYTGFDPYLGPVTKKLLEMDTEAGTEAVIPVAVVLRVQDDDTDNIRLWGDFGVFHYRADGTVLKKTAGDWMSGCMYLCQDGSEFVVTGFAQAAESAGREGVSLLDICEGRQDVADLFASDENQRENTRRTTISRYVAGNELPLDSYQNAAGEIVRLASGGAEDIEGFDPNGRFVSSADGSILEMYETGDGEVVLTCQGNPIQFTEGKGTYDPRTGVHFTALAGEGQVSGSVTFDYDHLVMTVHASPWEEVPEGSQFSYYPDQSEG